MEASGWYAAYGGNISVTNEEYHSGNYSLKMTNRTKAWQSPALNLDRIFYEGGPGIYVFTVWVKVKNVNPYLRKYARSIVRGQELTSFIQKYDENYFGKIALVDTVEDTWTCIQGWISVQSQDIHKGTFSWMLDVIDPIEGQIVYIDDFDIFKSSDNPNPNQAQVAVVNDKPFEKDYRYCDIDDSLSKDETAAVYYDNMVNIEEQDLNDHLELIYTLTEEQFSDFSRFVWEALKKEEQGLSQEETVDAIIDAALTIAGFIPTYGTVFSIVQIIFSLRPESKAYFREFWEEAVNLKPKTSQERVTYSICLLKSILEIDSLTGPAILYRYLEYTVYTSDGQSFKGTFNQDAYTEIINLCSYFVDNTTWSTPSRNKVYHGYSYIYEYSDWGRKKR